MFALVVRAHFMTTHGTCSLCVLNRSGGQVQQFFAYHLRVKWKSNLCFDFEAPGDDSSKSKWEFYSHLAHRQALPISFTISSIDSRTSPLLFNL